MMIRENTRGDLGKVSVIVQDSDDNQWTAFKYGLRMAAEDQRIEMFVVGTEGMMTAEEQEKIIQTTESKPQASAKTPKPESKPAQQLNEPTKVAESKSKSVEPKVAQPKPTPKQEPLTQKPANQAPNAKNGTVPTSGFYWQVGSFQKEPNEKFNTLIKKYPYRVQHAKSDSNTPITRYLIGPYKSRVEAPSKEEIGRIFEQDPTPVEIQ